MRALVALLLCAAPGPRTDGTWFPSKIAAKVVAGTATSIDLGSFVVFSAADVHIGYGMDDENRSWRAGAGGLEVKSGDDWRPLVWTPVKDGVVKTDIFRAGAIEELTFISKTVAQLENEKSERLKAALLAKVAGKWSGGGHALDLSASPALDGKPVRLAAVPCQLHCESQSKVPCAEVGEVGDSKLYLLQGKKLVEVSLEGACGGGEGGGVEFIEGAAALERK